MHPPCDAPTSTGLSTTAHTIIELTSAYAAEYPDEALPLLENLTTAIHQALTTSAPHIQISPDGTIINPRTEEPDELIAIDMDMHRETEAAVIDDQARAQRRIHFRYGDSESFYEHLCYVTDSDHLPVRLPEGWV